MAKSILRIILILILILVLVVGGYVGYVLLSYHRIDDNQVLEVGGNAPKTSVDVDPSLVYDLSDWNIGFAAYTDQFSFFMDGGEYSRAFSKEATIENMEAIMDELHSFNSDFYLIQEVDFESTRSYHVDQVAMLRDSFEDKFDSTFGINYDSAYLFYPLTSPIGSSHAGVMTFSSADIESSLRRSLPIQTGFAKFLDLDRCYTVNRIPTSDGKELVLINLHLSAYTTDDTIVTQQVGMLMDTMQEEYAKGNYVIAGGDFNMDLLGDSPSIFGVSGEDYSWAQPFPEHLIPDGLKLYAPLDLSNPVPSCRNADSPWDPKTNFQLTIDGFIISDNIKVETLEVVDTQFAFSDHNPVHLRFSFAG